MTETTTIPSRIAGLSAVDDSDDETETYRISGDAIGANDVTTGLERTRKVWLAEHLKPAASTLVGAPITPLHSEQEVGEVTRAGWDPVTETVVYEADLTDPKLADQVESGALEVSIEATHFDGGTDDATGAMIASDPTFTGLSLVQSGSAPSASAEAGPSRSAALSARLSAGQIDAVLDGETTAEAAVGDDPWTARMRTFRVVAPPEERENFDDDVLGVGVDFPESAVYVDWHREAFPDELDGPHVSEYDSLADLRKATGNDIVDFMPPRGATAEAAQPDEAALSKGRSRIVSDGDETAALDAGDVVSWNSQGSRPAAGVVLETIDEGRYDTELSGDATVTAPAALIRLHHPGPDGWERTDTTVAHKLDTLTAHAEWPDLEATAAASDYAFEDVPEEYVFENPGQATGAAEDLGLDEIHEHETDDGTVFMPGESMGDLFDALEEASELAEVKGVKYSGTASGELDESEIPNDDYASHYVFDAETKTESSYPLVDGSGDLRSGNVEAAYQLYGQAPDSELLLDVLAEVNDAFDDPPVDPESLAESREEVAEAAAADAAAESPGVDATPGATSDSDTDADTDSGSGSDSGAPDDAITPETGQAEASGSDPDSASTGTDTTTTDTTTDMTDEPTDNPEADEPSVDELKSELADVRETKSALQEDHEDLKAEHDDLESDHEALQSELESKADQIETAKREYAAALVDAGETLMDEDDLVERFELAELASKYDESEDAALAEDLPDEDPEPDIQSGGGGGETATLSDAELEEKQELESKLADLEGRDTPLAVEERERIENEIADLTEA